MTTQIARQETHCHHMYYSFQLAASVLLYASSHRQDNTYNGLCYTSCGGLAGKPEDTHLKTKQKQTTFGGVCHQTVPLKLSDPQLNKIGVMAYPGHTVQITEI